MAQLWDLGVRGTTLDVVAAWKEALLLVALIVVAWHARHFPAVKAADVLAMTYAAVIVVYWAIPQDVLGGEATARGELLALRHHLFPVAAYALGRLAAFAWEERGRVGGLIAMSAVVAVVGLADLASSHCRRGATPAYPVGTGSSSGSTTRVSPDYPRTGCSTRATRTTRSDGSSRRSSRRSPVHMRSSSR
jgi:hypothetical protein